LGETRSGGRSEKTGKKRETPSRSSFVSQLKEKRGRGGYRGGRSRPEKPVHKRWKGETRNAIWKNGRLHDPGFRTSLGEETFRLDWQVG